VTVSIVTENNLDPDGLVLLVDGTPLRILDPSGTVTVGPIPAGDHELEITGVAPNCSLQGENPRPVSVADNATLTVDFALSCVDPPGGRIFFYRSGISAAWISVMNVDGSAKVDLLPVQSVDEAGRLASSPDGRRIAFSDANEDGGLEIYLMDRAGGELRPLRPGGGSQRLERYPSWGPGGDEIVFEASNGLWQADTVSAPMEQLVSAQYTPRMPAWSPEGERLVWASGYFGHLMYKRDLRRALQVIREGEAVCGGGPCRDDLPIWSPDGTRILFRRIGVEPDYPGGMWIWDYESGQEELLAEGATWFDWSPDGSRIVYTDPEGIVVMNADGSGKIRVRSLSENSAADDESAYSRVTWGR
jgi:Tol biopolymer transport system component